jgi:ABC-type amino acid transport substrate-binding protein
VRYTDIFLKLAGGRIDYFPRSVQEIWTELGTHVDSGFAVEPSIALHYPAAMYFFVNRNNAALANDIRQGLERALADGTFEALFQRHFGPALKRAALDKRQVFELGNPLLPAETPLANRRLWWRP